MASGYLKEELSKSQEEIDGKTDSWRLECIPFKPNQINRKINKKDLQPIKKHLDTYFVPGTILCT